MATPAIHQLPAHILDLVFQHTERTALKECRLVCVLWYLLTTPYLFRCIQISSTSQIDEFIYFHENSASDQLVQFGKYVKRITTGEGIGMADTRISLENFEKFVKYCPEVTSVSVSLPVCRGSLYYYLFEFSGNIKWRLHRFDRNVENQKLKLNYYYKYKDTIKVIRWLEDTENFDFVIDFPLLEELALPSSAVITDIQGFMFICNACPNLTELDLYTNMNDHTRLVAGFAICPSLKTLNVKCRSLIPKVLVDYIAASLVNLSNITFWMEITLIQSNFGEIYNQLKDFLFTPQKEAAYLTLKAQTSYRDDTEKIYTMIDECLTVICRPSKLKACNFIKWIANDSSVLAIDLYMSRNHTIECKISIPLYLFIYFIEKDDFTSSKMPNFHKLCLERECRGLTMSRVVALFIEKACNLQELILRRYRLKDTYDYVYESVRILRIENSVFYPDFFKKLAISFPNLKELHLYEVSMLGNNHSFRSKLIDLGDLHLEKLSLTTDERFDSAKIPESVLVCVEVQKRRKYIKVGAGRILETLADEEGMAFWKRVPDNHTYLIMRNAPARFRLNNVYIKLTI
ncbi:hypothetical protein BCV72DRAFT_337514 [Rhizopus microsporus var. microsporus]|uniref:F-box domain-containing protein n=2 Tax=Rhizopus microsporus TaxID=58291 RepID=A0A2G4T413_RHIZD|nr:uncharacterized protein RHIMIDRAFT_92683 [Rhizopus microsporus ATCC 52813]ORE04139.1 hypothetical protein BCV72DRAFT_337514 [Rhizopus microsporus var. microsporus]PHZ15750.1 hypothetical protein RHIMIDRAFT_92683 [Rhizopus microsporus ATCC 52813]